jgi:hypothetical protein
MASETPSQTDVAIDPDIFQISLHHIHKAAHLDSSTLDHCHHVHGVLLIARLPGSVGLVADLASAMIGHVKCQRNEAALRRARCFVPSV